MYSIEDLFFDIFLFFAFGTVVIKILESMGIYTAESILLQLFAFAIIMVPIYLRHAFRKARKEDRRRSEDV